MDEAQAVFGEVQASKAFLTAAAVRVVDRALALSGGAGYLATPPAGQGVAGRPGGRLHAPHRRQPAAGLLGPHGARRRPGMSRATAHRARSACSTAASPSSAAPSAERRLVGVVAERRPAGRAPSSARATSSAPKMRWPARGRPHRADAARRRPAAGRAGPAARRSSAASSTASTTSRRGASG